MIPMILVTFFGGALSGMACYLMLLVVSGGFTVDNLFIGSIIIPLLLSRVWLKKSNRVFYLTIGLIALYRILVVWFLVDMRIRGWMRYCIRPFPPCAWRFATMR